MSRRIETQARPSDVRFRGIELNYAGVGGFPVESASMDEECQEEQASLQFSDLESSEDESGVEKGEISRLAGYEAEGTGCSEVLPSQSRSEVADVGAGMSSDEESVASEDMASSADMDGEDIGLRGDAEARILLWCAREIGDTVRMSVDTSFRAMELRVSAIEERLAGFDGMVAKLKKSRGVHRLAILESRYRAGPHGRWRWGASGPGQRAPARWRSDETTTGRTAMWTAQDPTRPLLI